MFPGGFSEDSMKRAHVVAVLLSIAGAGTLCAQENNPKVSILPRLSHRAEQNNRASGAIRLDVNLVLIPVTVTDSFERPVHGLQKEEFRLFEDGVEQNISQFFRQDGPISMGIVFDASTSMLHKLAESRKAVSEFLKLSVPGDEFFLLKFSDRPETVCDFTQDPGEIEDSVARIQSKGWTALFDAIYLGMHHMKRASNGRKVMLILSDGGDNNSRYNVREIRRLVREADVRLFAISILDRSAVLESLSEESGGRAFHVKKLEELPDLAAKLSLELHSEYVLGYSPSRQQNDGKYRKLTVELAKPAGGAPLRTSWRRGYYGPDE
jgi:Ca-activated chloride channel family protein